MSRMMDRMLSRMLRRWPLALAAIVAFAAPAAAADLALQRVMLSTGGVGYLEYAATVDGDATLSLDVGLDQVDDVLKSLVVYDAAGSAGEITLPGREPLSQSFSDLPFDRAALASAPDLLNALAGSEIRVGGANPISGRLIHVDEVQIRAADGHVESRTRVALASDSGIRQVTLQAGDAIAFADPALQAQVDAALARLAASRASGRRTLTLTVHGTGQRTIRVGYVVAMPLWKASYRLSLSADPQAATAQLQGWAVLENFSGQPWHDVELTLLSGNPVTFRQALYESYYVPRPVVPVESGGRVLPPPDTGTLGGVAPRAASVRPEPGDAGRATAKFRSFAAAPAPAPAVPPPPPAAIEAAKADEDATQIAFTAPRKISVAAGQSLVLPLIDRNLPVKQFDFYQPDTDARHPLAAVELTNQGGTGLPPGVLTLYRAGEHGAAYLGDARLAALPAGDKRLLSFAVDGKVAIDRSVTERRQLVKATIAEGVLHMSRTLRQTTTYRIKSAAGAPPLLIEQKRQPGWSLVAPDPKTAELTGSAFRIAVPAGSDNLAVVEERPLAEAIALTALGDDQLGAYVASSELDPRLHRIFAELAGRRQAVATVQAELDRLTAHRAGLVADEARYRDNLTALARDAALRKRETDKLAAAETEIDQVTDAIAKANAAHAAAQDDLAGYISGLKL